MSGRTSEMSPADATTKLLLTIDVAADCLSISRAHAWRLIGRGELPVIRLGHCTRVSRQALEAYIQRLEQEQRREAEST